MMMKRGGVMEIDRKKLREGAMKEEGCLWGKEEDSSEGRKLIDSTTTLSKSKSKCK